jgi:hypothetical protein
LDFQSLLPAGAAAQPSSDMRSVHIAVPEFYEPLEIKPVSTPAGAAGMKPEARLEVLPNSVDDDHLHERRS